MYVQGGFWCQAAYIQKYKSEQMCAGGSFLCYKISDDPLYNPYVHKRTQVFFTSLKKTQKEVVFFLSVFMKKRLIFF